MEESGEDVRLDWHGHNDRGLGLINALTAAYAGVDRLHGTALGIGERVGNTSIDQLLVNFSLLGWMNHDLSALGEYCDLVASCTGLPFRQIIPWSGRDAFRTATGVHAAAVIKALRKGDDMAGQPGVFRSARRVLRANTDDRNRTDEWTIQCDVLA